MFKYMYVTRQIKYLSLIKKPTSALLLILDKNYIYRHPVSNNNEIFLDNLTKTIVVKNTIPGLISHFNVNTYNTTLRNIYKGFFKKIKFTGKGFRLTSFKRKKIIEFIFGHSHMYLLYMQTIKYKRYNKYKYIFFSKNDLLLKKLIKQITYVKKINVYTLRGIRATKSLIIKRKGRKSPTL